MRDAPQNGPCGVLGSPSNWRADPPQNLMEGAEGPPPQNGFKNSQKRGGDPAPKWLQDPPKIGSDPLPKTGARPLTAAAAGGGAAGHAGSCSLAVGCEQGMLGVEVLCRQSGREARWEEKGVWQAGHKGRWEL